MFIGVTQSKKVPRFLKAYSESLMQPLKNVKVLWPDRTESLVYDLSLGGMVVSAEGALGKYKLYDSFDFLLCLPQIDEPLVLTARIVSLNSQIAALNFESITVDRRLMLEQSFKDQLIYENLRSLPVTELPFDLQGQMWLHGPFDTNLILWTEPNSNQVYQSVIEYENLVWFLSEGDSILKKTVSAVEDSQKYLSLSDIQHKGAKVSMGASWLDRLIKCLEKVQDERGDVFQVLQWLKSQRVQ